MGHSVSTVKIYTKIIAHIASFHRCRLWKFILLLLSLLKHGHGKPVSIPVGNPMCNAKELVNICWIGRISSPTMPNAESSGFNGISLTFVETNQWENMF